MENAVDWRRAICIMAIALGCFSGCTALLGLGISVVGDHPDRPRATEAAIARQGSLERVSDGLLFAHACALIGCGLLGLRDRPRSAALLRVAFRAGVPLVVLAQAWTLSRQWSLRGALPPASAARSSSASLVIVALLSLGWATLKVSFFVGADRYLAREVEPH